MSKTFQINTELKITNNEWTNKEPLQANTLYTVIKDGYRLYPIEEPINLIVEAKNWELIQIRAITLEKDKTFIWFMLWISKKQ